MKFLAFLLVLLLAAGSAFAQPARKHDRGGGMRQMSQEERQQMREQVRDAYRQRQERPDRPRQMTPEEREKLRRDVQDANRDLRRR